MLRMMHRFCAVHHHADPYMRLPFGDPSSPRGLGDGAYGGVLCGPSLTSFHHHQYA